MYIGLLIIVSLYHVLGYEVFMHRIKAGRSFDFREVIFPANGFNIIIKGINLNEQDSFEVHHVFHPIDQDEKMSRTDSKHMEVFKGSKNKPFFQKGYTASDRLGDEIIMAGFRIDNMSYRELVFEININEYLFGKTAFYEANQG